MNPYLILLTLFSFIAKFQGSLDDGLLLAKKNLNLKIFILLLNIACLETFQMASILKTKVFIVFTNNVANRSENMHHRTPDLVKEIKHIKQEFILKLDHILINLIGYLQSLIVRMIIQTFNLLCNCIVKTSLLNSN